MNNMVNCVFLIIALTITVLTIITYWWNRKIAEGMQEIHNELVLMNDRMEHISKIISKHKPEV